MAILPNHESEVNRLALTRAEHVELAASLEQTIRLLRKAALRFVPEIKGKCIVAKYLRRTPDDAEEIREQLAFVYSFDYPGEVSPYPLRYSGGREVSVLKGMA
jgi:hypothetical protein